MPEQVLLARVCFPSLWKRCVFLRYSAYLLYGVVTAAPRRLDKAFLVDPDPIPIHEPDIVLNHNHNHSMIFQPDVALEPDQRQPLSWASLAPPEAASFNALPFRLVGFSCMEMEWNGLSTCELLYTSSIIPRARSPIDLVQPLMDHHDDLAIQYLLLDEDEAELQFDDDERAWVLAAAIIGGSEVARQDRIDTRHPHHLYLCRPQLLPNPRMNTPWQALYDSQNDRAFITTMGVDVPTFSSLLAAGFAQAWFETPIPRDDVSVHGNPRINQRSLDAAGALGLVLHYLSSTMHAISLQQIFAIIPSTGE
ncbi:hypothetical protein F4604DRAFT_1917639 [Suillus subluteus]|nr:hypothetical protein F4604DRAFT_1917639 [Suillus subluteus]